MNEPMPGLTPPLPLFTQEDVDLLRRVEDVLGIVNYDLTAESVERLADRIEHSLAAEPDGMPKSVYCSAGHRVFATFGGETWWVPGFCPACSGNAPASPHIRIACPSVSSESGDGDEAERAEREQHLQEAIEYAKARPPAPPSPEAQRRRTVDKPDTYE